MTSQQFLSLSDVLWKLGTPIALGLVAWNAARVVEKLDKLEDGFSSVKVAIERHETRIIYFDESLKAHLQTPHIQTGVR